MSRLLWFLTGAGNVDNIQCPQRKADRDKGGGGGGGVFIPTASVYLQVLCCIQGDNTMVLIKTSVVKKTV